MPVSPELMARDLAATLRALASTCQQNDVALSGTNGRFLIAAAEEQVLQLRIALSRTTQSMAASHDAQEPRNAGENVVAFHRR